MSSTRRTHLRTRILVWLFVPTAIILSAVAFTLYFAYQRVTADLVVGRNQQLTHLSAGQLASNLNSYVDTLAEVARNTDISGGDPFRQSIRLAQVSNQLLVFDGGTIILDPLGKIVTTQPPRPDLLEQDWSKSSFFRQILHGAQPTFSDIIPPPGVQNTPEILAVAVPILNSQSEFRGILVGLFRMGQSSSSAFYGGIVRLRLGENGTSYLVDGTGRVIYHPDERLIGEDSHTEAFVQQAMKGQVGYLRAQNRDGVDVLATFAPVPGTHWALINEVSWTSLLASSQGYGQFLYLLLGLGILIPTLVVLFGVKRITDPLAKLRTAAIEIAGGKFGQQISVQTGDELEELSEQFNRMSGQLQESYTRLEERVAARTRELAALNATAAVASHSLDLEEILKDALDKTLEVLGMELGGAYCIEGPNLVLMAQRNLSDVFVRQVSPRPLKGSVAELAYEAGRAVGWGLETFPEIRLKPWLESERIEQVICVPLIAKGNLVGAFILGTHKSRSMTAEESRLLAAIGQQIGVAVENAHLYQRAEESAATAERTRLARDLHDAVTQTLFSASLIAEVLPDVWNRDQGEGLRRLEELRQLTRGALAEMRTLLVELRPNALVEIPLPDLLRQLCESLIGRARLPIELSVQGEGKLPPDVQISFYRITQEALNNVVKYSKATQAVVTLVLNRSVRLSVADNGSGFEPENVPPDHLGLKIMQERADAIGAKLNVYSEPGEGTQISVTWQRR